eukprot:249776_1
MHNQDVIMIWVRLLLVYILLIMLINGFLCRSGYHNKKIDNDASDLCEFFNDGISAGGPCWIGLDDIAINNFVWQDGSDLDKTFWGLQEPSSSYECTALYDDTTPNYEYYYWWVRNCANTYHFICNI